MASQDETREVGGFAAWDAVRETQPHDAVAAEVTSQRARADAAEPPADTPPPLETALEPASGDIAAPGAAAGAGEATPPFVPSPPRAGTGANAGGVIAANDGGAGRPEEASPLSRHGAVRFCHRGDGVALSDEALDACLAALRGGGPRAAAGDLLCRVEFEEDGSSADLSLQQMVDASAENEVPLQAAAPPGHRVAALVAAYRDLIRAEPHPSSAPGGRAGPKREEGELAATQPTGPDDDNAAAGADAGPPPRRFRGVTWTESYGGCWHVRIRNRNNDETVGYFDDQVDGASG